MSALGRKRTLNFLELRYSFPINNNKGEKHDRRTSLDCERLSQL